MAYREEGAGSYVGTYYNFYPCACAGAGGKNRVDSSGTAGRQEVAEAFSSGSSLHEFFGNASDFYRRRKKDAGRPLSDRQGRNRRLRSEISSVCGRRGRKPDCNGACS